MAVTGAGLAYYYQGEKEKKQQQGTVIGLGFVSFFSHVCMKYPHVLEVIPPPFSCALFRTRRLASSPHPSLLPSPPFTNCTALGKVTSYGKPALGGPWTLVDFTGKPVTDADFRGEFLLLYFGFTHCPDICPSELVKVGRILDLLDKEQSLPMVRPVFISVDPDRDNVGQLRHYAQGAFCWVLA